MKKVVVLLMITILTLVMFTSSSQASVSNMNTDVHYVTTSYVTEKTKEPQEQEPKIGISIDYGVLMLQYALEGNRSKGILTERERNKKIDDNNLKNVKVSYDDLRLLTKVIIMEAGSSWLSDEWKLSVGEVLLNRVASPEFPNTLYKCVYQKGQYANVYTSKFKNMKLTKRETKLAWRLLSGERHLVKSVVFQSESRQGSGVYKVLQSRGSGTTYFCYSRNRKLYTK